MAITNYQTRLKRSTSNAFQHLKCDVVMRNIMSIKKGAK